MKRLIQRQGMLLYLIGYLTWGAVAIISVQVVHEAGKPWWWVGGPLLAFALVQALIPEVDAPIWKRHLYLAIQSLLALIPILVSPEAWSASPILYFILSAQAMLLFSLRLGLLWIGLFVLLSGVAFVYTLGWNTGLLTLLPYSAGYLFFGAFAQALANAEAARRRSQALLADLQEAHRQLQEYALRIEELAVVEERNRLAREMHDTLGHRLTVAAVQLEAAQRLCPTDPERAAILVGNVREQVREALGELRATVATLRAPVEADLQLPTALRRLTDHFEQATGLKVHRVLPEEMPSLPNTHRLALYRAAQEALTNVQKHAAAGQVWLVLNVGDGAISLLIGDDGRGPSPDRQAEGFGLQGLRERAAQLGGELHLEPRPGGGTQLSFRLPLADGNKQHGPGNQ